MRLRKPPGRRFGPPSPIPHFEFNTRCSARPERTFGSSAEGSAALPDRYVRDSQLVSARTTVSFRQTHQDAPLFVRSLGTAPAATPGMAESNNQQPRQIPFSLATVRASSAMKGSLQDGRHASLSAAVSSRILGGDAGPTRQVARLCFRSCGIPAQQRGRLARMRRAPIRRAYFHPIPCEWYPLEKQRPRRNRQSAPPDRAALIDAFFARALEPVSPAHHFTLKVAFLLLAGRQTRLPCRSLLARRRSYSFDLRFLGLLGFPISFLLALGHVDLLLS